MEALKNDPNFTGKSFIEEVSIIGRDISFAVAFCYEWLGVWDQDSELITQGIGVLAITGIAEVIRHYEKTARESQTKIAK